MGLRDQFATDSSLETKGIVVDYGDDRIRIARAGGANKRYERLLESKTKHLRRAISVGAISGDQSMAILREVYAETVILDWQHNVGTLEDPVWEKGINPKDVGDESEGLLPVNPENVKRVLIALPDLFIDLQQQAQVGALYRQEINEASAGN